MGEQSYTIHVGRTAYAPSPCQEQNMHLHWRNHTLGGKKSTQEGVCMLPTIFPRGLQTLLVTRKTGRAIKGNSKVALLSRAPRGLIHSMLQSKVPSRAPLLSTQQYREVSHPPLILHLVCSQSLLFGQVEFYIRTSSLPRATSATKKMFLPLSGVTEYL